MDEVEEDELELVRTKRFDLKPMDVEEAILQMDMLGHNFFVFTNADTNETNVVYGRKDGKYGLIETIIIRKRSRNGCAFCIEILNVIISISMYLLGVY